MSAQEIYHHFIQHDIGPLLKDRGFRKSRQTFWKDSDMILAVISFQKSQWNSNEVVSFTVNVGIASKRLMPAHPAHRPPRVEACVVQERIGWLLPIREDLWWEIRSDTDIDRVADDVKAAIVRGVLPFIRRFPNDQALLSYWAEAIAYGGRSLHTMRFGAALSLAAALGNDELVRAIQEHLSANA